MANLIPGIGLQPADLDYRTGARAPRLCRILRTDLGNYNVGDLIRQVGLKVDEAGNPIVGGISATDTMITLYRTREQFLGVIVAILPDDPLAIVPAGQGDLRTVTYVPSSKAQDVIVWAVEADRYTFSIQDDGTAPDRLNVAAIGCRSTLVRQPASSSFPTAIGGPLQLSGSSITANTSSTPRWNGSALTYDPALPVHILDYRPGLAAPVRRACWTVKLIVEIGETARVI